MSPEQRADAVIDAIMDQIMSLIQINGEPITSVDVLNPAPSLIAAAIKEAEDAAYERAADKVKAARITAFFDGTNQERMAERNDIRNRALVYASDLVLALKSQEP